MAMAGQLAALSATMAWVCRQEWQRKVTGWVGGGGEAENPCGAR